jgi:AcrR family transcriptional regulator
MTAAAVAAGRGARAQAQRERILDAAERCFVAQGFHAASMASVAQAASMSPGLIYRYFPSKHAIILGIIERQLEKGRARIAALSASTDLAQHLTASFREWRDRSSAEFNVPLFLSMNADAARDATIADALRASDRSIRTELVAWLQAAAAARGGTLDATTAAPRAALLQSLFEGMALRSVREPDLDLAAMEPQLRRLFAFLLEP